MGEKEKLLEIASIYYQYHKKDPLAKFEWIYRLILNHEENWRAEADLFIKDNHSDKNLMRQLLFSIYSAGLSYELKSITKLIRELTMDSAFLSRELGDIFIMRMDYQSGISEYILYLEKNQKDLKAISDKVMTLPKDEYVLNIVREIFIKDKNNFSKIILSNLEFREQNYISAWE